MKTKIESNVHIGGWKEACPNQITILIAEGNYTKLYFADGSKTIVATTLKILEKRLKSNNSLFFRAHRSCLINLSFVANHENLELNEITMSDKRLVRVSKRKKMSLKEKLHGSN
jgi:DNA-binding LytR/AlgR family response regulator